MEAKQYRCVRVQELYEVRILGGPFFFFPKAFILLFMFIFCPECLICFDKE